MKQLLHVTLLSCLFLATLVSAAFAWECPSCNIDNFDNFCPNCGQRKPLEKCKNCAIALESEYAFCPNCGTPAGSSASPGVPNMFGFNMTLDEARPVVVEYLEDVQNYGFTAPSTIDSYPVCIDHHSMLTLGNALLSSDPLPEAVQGSWTIYLFDSLGNSISEAFGMVGDLSSVQGRNLGSIMFERDGVIYEFLYNNKQLVYYSVLISQNPNPTDAIMIRYAGPYMEWDFLSSFDFANRDTLRVCVATEAQKADGSTPVYFVEYDVNSGTKIN